MQEKETITSNRYGWKIPSAMVTGERFLYSSLADLHLSLLDTDFEHKWRSITRIIGGIPYKEAAWFVWNFQKFGELHVLSNNMEIVLSLKSSTNKISLVTYTSYITIEIKQKLLMTKTKGHISFSSLCLDELKWVTCLKTYMYKCISQTGISVINNTSNYKTPLSFFSQDCV